jgi:hypothetical protein
VPSPGANAFAGIAAPFRTQAGQIRACRHKPTAFAVRYLTSAFLLDPPS